MGYLTISYILSVIASLATLCESWFSGQLLDKLVSGKSIVISMVFITATILIQYLCITINIYVKGNGIEKTLSNIRNLMSEKLNSIEYVFLEKLETGDILSVTLKDLNDIKNFFSSSVPQIGKIFTAAVSIIICFLLGWKLMLICLFSLIIILFIGFSASSPVQRASFEARIQRGIVNNNLVNILSNIINIKSYTLEHTITEKYNETMKKALFAELKEAKTFAVAAAVNRLLGGLSLLAIFVTGAFFVFSKEMSLGSFFAFAFIFSNIQNLQNILELITSYKNYKAASQRVNRLLSIQDEINDAEVINNTDKVAKVADITEDYIISFSNVTFSYNYDKIVLDNISFKIKKGERIAFIGQSGSGKSTIIKLLLAMYQPDDGNIFIDRVSTTYCRDLIRKKIAVVTQSNYLFPLTIGENIKVGNPGASESELIEACINADIYDYIKMLPSGFDTDVGELGEKLSGGQRQRICLARAFLKNAPIIILDEPTSSLDVFTEANIMLSVNKLMDNRTTIIISHRHSTIKDVDRVFCIADGKIVQEGTPFELASVEGLYRSFFEKKGIKEGDELLNGTFA